VREFDSAHVVACVACDSAQHDPVRAKVEQLADGADAKDGARGGAFPLLICTPLPLCKELLLGRAGQFVCMGPWGPWFIHVHGWGGSGVAE
jgi:hypothetical protein